MRVTDEVVDFFDMVSITEWNRSLQRTLVHWIGIHDRMDVLDAGCRTGRFTLQLAQRARQVTGIDVSDLMINKAQTNASRFETSNIEFAPGDVRQMVFGDASFDLVTCLNLFFLMDRPESAMSEMVRVTRPGGQIILFNPSSLMNPWSAQTYCERHRWRDFERDSLMSWSYAAVKRNLLDETDMHRLAESCGGTVTDVVQMFDGLADVTRIVPAV